MKNTLEELKKEFEKEFDYRKYHDYRGDGAVPAIDPDEAWLWITSVFEKRVREDEKSKVLKIIEILKKNEISLQEDQPLEGDYNEGYLDSLADLYREVTYPNMPKIPDSPTKEYGDWAKSRDFEWICHCGSFYDGNVEYCMSCDCYRPLGKK